jgi:hypothetical protein
MNEIKEKAKNNPAEETDVQKEMPRQARRPKDKKGKPVLFSREDASRWLPFTLFLFILVVVYISLQQYAEKLVRNTEKLNRDIKELRSEFLSTKAELMQESMQTDIAKKLESSGLKELREPAIRLKVEKETKPGDR